jgi:hypothetical protein
MPKAKKIYIKRTPRAKKKDKKGGPTGKRAKKLKKLAEQTASNMGRPSSYHPEYAKSAETLCKLGATDNELADFFDVTTVTIWNWKARHQDFFRAIDKGKKHANEKVEAALYARATGMTYDSEKIFCNKDGDVTRVHTKEYLPPSEKAMGLWLTNRDPDRWKERRMNEFDPDAPLNIRVEGGLPK